MIDTDRIDTSRPIDLAAICNSKAYKIDRNGRQFGVNLVCNVCELYVVDSPISKFSDFSRFSAGG